jgi:hypothetical protein
MDLWKYFDITHREHVFCNPMSVAVRAVEAEFDIHDEIQDRLRLIMKAVKETWPKM